MFYLLSKLARSPTGEAVKTRQQSTCRVNSINSLATKWQSRKLCASDWSTLGFRFDLHVRLEWLYQVLISPAFVAEFRKPRPYAVSKLNCNLPVRFREKVSNESRLQLHDHFLLPFSGNFDKACRARFRISGSQMQVVAADF